MPVAAKWRGWVQAHS